MNSLKLTVLAQCLFFPLMGLADLAKPVRTVDQLTMPQAEQTEKVKTARIVLADYGLIRKDFPETLLMQDREIDLWLLETAGYISQAQASQQTVNSKIEIETTGPLEVPVLKTAYRPQAYGRALVYPTRQSLALIEAKGAGAARKPILASHRTGLASLGEVIREFFFQKKVQQIFDHSGSKFQTVGSYAVIDWGFDAADLDGKFAPAGAILRQAHARAPLTKTGPGNHFADIVDTKIIENLLRAYGVTSTGDASTDKFERANIQVTKTGEVVDFGAFLVKSHFTKTIVSYAYDELLEKSESTSFIQPNPRLSLPVSVWGASETGVENPRYDNPWVWSHRLAQDLRSGQARREHVELHFQNFMSAGSLPQDLQGSFKHLQTAEFRRQTMEELIRALPIDQLTSDELTEAYIKTTPLKDYDPTILEKIITASVLKNDHEYYLRLFDYYQIFRRFPNLLGKFFELEGRIPPDILLTLLKFRMDRVLDQVIQKRLVNTSIINRFLRSEQGKSAPQWPKWIAFEMTQPDSVFDITYLAMEPRTGKYPSLFTQALLMNYQPELYMKALRKPHWANSPDSPELIEKLIKHLIRTLGAEASRPLIDNLLQTGTRPRLCRYIFSPKSLTPNPR